MQTIHFQCPICGGGAHQRFQWPHFNYVHWALNPGLAINEIVMGLRIAKTTFVCTGCTTPLFERCYLHCPRCNKFQTGLLWGKPNHLWHWFGLICPDCGDAIPSFRNATAVAIEWLTIPFWYVPVHRWKPQRLLEERERVNQMRRTGTAHLSIEVESRATAIRQGMLAGLLWWGFWWAAMLSLVAATYAIFPGTLKPIRSVPLLPMLLLFAGSLPVAVGGFTGAGLLTRYLLMRRRK